MAETKWGALHLLSDAAGSIASTLVPAGLDNSKGVITVAFRKDPNDAAWADDPGMKDYLAFMKRYMPDANPSETFHVFGYATAQTFVHVLKNCGAEVTRENLMKQATSINDLELPIMLPGIKFNTSADAIHAHEPGTADAVRRRELEADRRGDRRGKMKA